ncbi:hypothetical protein KR50_18710 [Jeotgalibacillus campisalis]|uniref:Uncharacterized protein n=1 Tax=Jeotgalibacillus campisalis TaxID=220754 RepID=A0A0C2S0X8_9BACL|nr:hypothetical protein KR50_18710 [Jeotgalibacillus campisalis]
MKPFSLLKTDTTFFLCQRKRLKHNVNYIFLKSNYFNTNDSEITVFATHL